MDTSNTNTTRNAQATLEEASPKLRRSRDQSPDNSLLLCCVSNFALWEKHEVCRGTSMFTPCFKHPADRPVLLVCYKKADTCLDHLPQGDTLVVWRLDRFGRSLKDLVTKIEALHECSVEFASLTEGIDTTTAQGRLAFHLSGAMAEFEREIARKRTMVGLRAARERVGGRPRALSEEDMPQVQALMKDPDVSTAQICERFDVSNATLYRYVIPKGDRSR